jgi:hypothetical protein
VKGLAGRSNTRAKPLLDSPLMQQYPFSRLTHPEIVDLFHSFRVQLGSNDIHRDNIIANFRNIPRDRFNNLINEIIEHSEENTFESVTVIPTVSEGI